MRLGKLAKALRAKCKKLNMKARKLPTPAGEPVALQPPEPTPFPGASPEPNDELPWEGSDEDHPWIPRYLWMQTSLRPRSAVQPATL